MSCAQISISGSGQDIVAPATVSIPGMYHSTDPGIVTSIFGVTSYTVPGTAYRCLALTDVTVVCRTKRVYLLNSEENLGGQVQNKLLSRITLQSALAVCGSCSFGTILRHLSTDPRCKSRK